jgi:hypothetical protein
MILLKNEYWEVKTTKDKGKGLFARKIIPTGVIIGDYLGKVLRTRDLDMEFMKNNLYLMYYHDQASIYPDLEKDGIHLINHSCSPNCWIYTYKGHTLVFALKEIFPDEELTISYLLAPKGPFCNPCPHICKCGSRSCSKTFHISEDKFRKWRDFQSAREKKDKRARIKYGGELKILPSYPTKIPNDYIKTVLLDLIQAS